MNETLQCVSEWETGTLVPIENDETKQKKKQNQKKYFFSYILLP